MNTGEVQFFKLRQTAQRLQSFVGDQGVPQIEPPQLLQTREALQPLVAERSVGQIERLQVNETRQAELRNTALRAAYLLQLRQTAEIGQALILNVHIRQKVETEMETLQVLEPGEIFQLVICIQAAARGRI